MDRSVHDSVMSILSHRLIYVVCHVPVLVRSDRKN
jgi:hypothetical protein